MGCHPSLGCENICSDIHRRIMLDNGNWKKENLYATHHHHKAACLICLWNILTLKNKEKFWQNPLKESEYPVCYVAKVLATPQVKQWVQVILVASIACRTNTYIHISSNKATMFFHENSLTRYLDEKKTWSMSPTTKRFWFFKARRRINSYWSCRSQEILASIH